MVQGKCLPNIAHKPPGDGSFVSPSQVSLMLLGSHVIHDSHVVRETYHLESLVPSVRATAIVSQSLDFN